MNGNHKSQCFGGCQARSATPGKEAKQVAFPVSVVDGGMRQMEGRVVLVGRAEEGGTLGLPGCVFSLQVLRKPEVK